MDKNRLVATTKYQLSLLTTQTIIFSLILVINLIIGIILKANNVVGGSIEIVTLVWACIIGAYMFSEAFNFSLINGVARSTFFVASTISTFSLAIVWSLITTIFVMISEQFAQNFLLFNLIYEGNIMSRFLWCFSAILLMMSLSWLVAVVLNAVTKRTKLILLAFFVVIGPLIMLLNNFIPGLMEKIIEVLLMYVGIFDGGANAHLASIFFIISALVNISLSWLFIRRMELK